MSDNMIKRIQHCLTGETLVSLADGSRKALEDVTSSDVLLAWDFYEGHVTTSTAAILFKTEPSKVDVTRTVFINEETGERTTLSIIGEHGVFDIDTGKYEYLGNNKSCRMLIDHRFAILNPDGTIGSAILRSLNTSERICRAYSPISDEHICVFAEGLLTASDAIEGIINCFEVDTKSMRYDRNQMQIDISKYGLFIYDDLHSYCCEDLFNSLQLQYLKVAMGKELITFDILAWLIVTYVPERGTLAITRRA